MAGIAPERVAAAAGLSNFCRITAGPMGTSIVTTLWEERAALHHAHLTDGKGALDPAFNQAVDVLVLSGMSAQAALAQALIFLALIGLVWLTRRPVPVAAPGGAR